jgi:galactose mutarotase-like enzyme
MKDDIKLDNGTLSATIAARGAELVSLRAGWSGELIWSGEPSIWPWHAPNLFPIVGALADDTLIHNGRAYPMKQHGILRISTCEIVEAAAAHCALRLVDTPEARLHYPFAFALTIRFRLDGDRLEQSFELVNPGTEPLPASLGAHPAFCWPLDASVPRENYRVLFAEDEPDPIRRLDGRALGGAHPTPVVGSILTLRDELFTDDALIFDRLRSRRLVFGSENGAGIELGFGDFPDFGIWSKPGAGFLCLEPWQGYASPVGFAGDFTGKPGIVTLAPGSSRRWSLSIRPVRNVSEEH